MTGGFPRAGRVRRAPSVEFPPLPRYRSRSLPVPGGPVAWPGWSPAGNELPRPEHRSWPAGGSPVGPGGPLYHHRSRAGHPLRPARSAVGDGQSARTHRYRRPSAVSATSPEALDRPFDPLERGLKVGDGVGIGQAEVAFAVGAEGCTSQGRDTGLGKEVICEGTAVHSDISHVGECIERAGWGGTAQTRDLVEAVHNNLPALSELLDHAANIILGALEGGDARALDCRRRAGDRVRDQAGDVRR